MREFFGKLYDDLMHETWANDAPSMWFTFNTVFACNV